MLAAYSELLQCRLSVTAPAVYATSSSSNISDMFPNPVTQSTVVVNSTSNVSSTSRSDAVLMTEDSSDTHTGVSMTTGRESSVNHLSHTINEVDMLLLQFQQSVKQLSQSVDTSLSQLSTDRITFDPFQIPLIYEQFPSISSKTSVSQSVSAFDLSAQSESIFKQLNQLNSGTSSFSKLGEYSTIAPSHSNFGSNNSKSNIDQHPSVLSVNSMSDTDVNLVLEKYSDRLIELVTEKLRLSK